jgi:hypothetical protein
MLEVGFEKVEVNHDENGDAFCHIEPEKPFHRGSVNRAGGNWKARSVATQVATMNDAVANANFLPSQVLLEFRHEFNRSSYGASERR